MRLLGIVMFLGLAVWSGVLYQRDRSESVVPLAVALERGQPVVRGDLLSAAQLPAGLDCRSTAIRAMTTVQLAALDAQRADLREIPPLELERSRDFFRRALECLPGDGNLWVRLARLELSLGARPEDIARHLLLSQSASPAEEQVILARLSLYLTASPGLKLVLASVWRRDLDVFLGHANWPALRSLFALVGSPLPADVETAIQNASPSQRRLIEAVRRNWEES